VSEYYGKVLASSSDLKTSACTACGLPPLHVRAAMRNVPQHVIDKFYGCGNPIPAAIEGLTVLDLGSGSGRDVFVAAQFVGKTGEVIGIDMTDEQLDTARGAVAEFAANCPDAAPCRFVKGFIEGIAEAGVVDGSVDLVVSNCVVNLSPNKPAVLEGVFRALKFGGEFYFSDVYCDRRLPDAVRKHEVLFGECLSGAMTVNDFVSAAKRAGFRDPRVLESKPIEVTDPELSAILGGAQFFSITFRLFKFDDADEATRLDDNCEDFGEIAIYNGGMKDVPFAYQLDDHHVFEKKRPVRVCGNTSSMVGASWLKPFFTIIGDRSTHFGAFPCGPAQAPAAGGGAAACAPGACGPGGC
jgi:SAM-dependent methyltransferase